MCPEKPSILELGTDQHRMELSLRLFRSTVGFLKNDMVIVRFSTFRAVLKIAKWLCVSDTAVWAHVVNNGVNACKLDDLPGHLIVQGDVIFEVLA